MPASTKTPTGPLTNAAAALEAELARYEETSTGLDKIPLNSDKTLQRARKVLEDCAQHQQALAVLLPAFAQAMQAAQERQQQCMDVTATGTARIKSRFDERVALLERVAALGERAQEINKPVAAMSASFAAAEAEGGSSNSPNAEEILKSLEEVSSRTESVIGEADSVYRAATDADWQDIARDADTLKQQLQSARNKIVMTQRSLASRAPS